MANGVVVPPQSVVCRWRLGGQAREGCGQRVSVAGGRGDKRGSQGRVRAAVGRVGRWVRHCRPAAWAGSAQHPLHPTGLSGRLAKVAGPAVGPASEGPEPGPPGG